MAYKITLRLPSGWTSEQDVYEDECGAEVTHLECHLPNDKAETDEAFIDLYAGTMPEDTTAADEALANYADIVGWDEEDDQEDPIVEWPFGDRKAYGFEALCEDDSPLRVMCIEIRKGVLVIMSIIAKDDDKLVETVQLVERNLRVNK